MDEIELKAHGKINLSLDVLGRRDDGYHEVKMIMHTVALHDGIFIKKEREEKMSEKKMIYIFIKVKIIKLITTIN